MSILGSIGNFFGGLGRDVSQAFNWGGRELGQLGHWLSNPVHDLEAIGGAAAIALPFLAPEILGGLGAAGGLGDILGLGGAGAAAGDVGAGITSLAAEDAALGGAGLTTSDILGGAAGAGTGFDALAAAGPDVLGASASAGPLDLAAAGAGATPGAAAWTAGGLDLLGPGVGAGAPLDLSAAGAGAGAGAGAASGGGGFLSSLGGAITAHPLQALGVGLGAASIGSSLLQRMTGLPYEGQLKAGAAQAQGVAAGDFGLAKQYGAPLATGVLPPQWEAAVQNSAKQAADTIRSQYASMGLANSSSEAGDIAAMQARIPEVRMQIAQGMAQIGVAYSGQALQALGLSDSIYTALMDATIKQDSNLTQAIASFAGAAARSSALTSKAA